MRIEGGDRLPFRELLYKNASCANVRRIHVNMERILSRWDGENCIFTDPVIYHLEDLLVFFSPMERRKMSNEIVEGFLM